mgnify:CR=1 FL=1|tara:strand:+ start:1620 stop:2405 length:786 start_codon:yes stop_codon:yes gene_type:complete
MSLLTHKLKLLEKIRKNLRNNKLSIGTWQQIPNSSISEILGDANYDWVAIDMEHGSINKNQLPNLFRAIELGGTLPLVRLAKPSGKLCKDALDSGAGGVIVPMITNASQLKKIHNACCWPPNGSRGVGFSRANLFGKYFNDYKKVAQSPFLVAQIEQVNALDNLEQILQVNGLDAVIIGPYDLSASMGLTGEINNPKVREVINEISILCDKYKVPFGDHITDLDERIIKKRIKAGYKFIAYGTDGLFLLRSCSAPAIKEKS